MKEGDEAQGCVDKRPRRGLRIPRKAKNEGAAPTDELVARPGKGPTARLLGEARGEPRGQRRGERRMERHCTCNERGKGGRGST